VEAAVSVVALVIGAFEFVGLEDLGGDVLRGSEGKGCGEFGARQGGGVSDDGEHFVANGLVGGVGEVGGVGAAGVGDEDTAEVSQGGLEKCGLGGEIHLFNCRTDGLSPELAG
jgi:hypothetical protein